MNVAGAVFRTPPPQEKAEALRARAAALRSQVETLQARERDLAAKEQQEAREAELRQATADKLRQRYARLGILSTLGYGAALAAGAGAFLATPLLGPLAVGALAGALWATRERSRLDHGIHVLGFSAGNQKMLSQLTALQAVTLKQQRGEIESQLREVERERQAAEVAMLVDRHARPPGSIEPAEESVSIGGVVLPRQRS